MKKFKWQVFFSISILAALTLACSSITSLPGLGGDDALLRDDFSDSNSGWGTGTDDLSSVEYGNGGLQFIVFSDKYFTWSTPSTEAYENIHIETSVKNDSSDRLAVFGFICHEQGSTTAFYYLGVAADGYYAISKSSVAQDDVILTDGTSASIPSGTDPFTIGADCGNGNLALYVNGQQIASANDSSYTSGSPGLFAASGDQPSAVDVTFDDVVITSLTK